MGGKRTFRSQKIGAQKLKVVRANKTRGIAYDSTYDANIEIK